MAFLGGGWNWASFVKCLGKTLKTEQREKYKDYSHYPWLAEFNYQSVASSVYRPCKVVSFTGVRFAFHNLSFLYTLTFALLHFCA